MAEAVQRGSDVGRSPRPQGLWAETATSLSSSATLEGMHDGDVAIIGAGYTGLTAALYLAEAGVTVHVLDRHQPGWGCSGRNGGQVNPGFKLDPDEILAHYGPQDGPRALNVARSTCDLVFELIDKYAIECQAVRPGYVQGGVGSHGERALVERVRQWQAHGEAAQLLNRREVSELLGTEAYDHGMHHATGGNLQPLSFARGLAGAAMAHGATIHGHSPATSLERSGPGWLVRSNNGSLKVQHVLFATNGYTDALWPGLAKAVVPVSSVIAATEPLSDNVAKSILPGRHAVSETLRVQVYYRKDGDGRFVIGGRGPVWGDTDSFSDKVVRQTAERYFPALKGVQWHHKWGGWVAMTYDHAPKLMRLAPGVLASMGCNGRGLAMSTMFGKQMALEVLGEGAEMPITEQYYTPFHAFRNLGVWAHVARGRLLDRFI
ncbi:MAG: FAD-binding oxidoreductase [Rhizobiales bacterium]|nr:FAD-binding oxidoreductase [Hyphomicrobiales bacterium]